MRRSISPLVTLLVALLTPPAAHAKSPCNGLRYQQAILDQSTIEKTGLPWLPQGAAQHLSEAMANKVGVIIPLDASIIAMPTVTAMAPSGFKTITHGLVAAHCNINLRYMIDGSLINKTMKSVSLSVRHNQGYIAYDPQDHVVIVGRPR